MASPTWTIKSLLQWTTEYLHKKNFESPRLEAQLLLAHVLNCSKIELVARSLEEPSDAERTRFRELIQKRVDGVPVAYLIGEREFYLLKFTVTPATLIPRPETETLVMEALSRLKSRPNATILDLGTGSGCIAISLAHQLKGINVVAGDISQEALAVARGNAQRHGVADRVHFRHGDLFKVCEANERFDLIVSNPPYISDAELPTLDVGVRGHEPRQALAAGVDGLDFYHRIVADAGPFLKPGGSLLLEIGMTQGDAVRSLLEASPDFGSVTIVNDMSRRPRVVTAIRA